MSGIKFKLFLLLPLVVCTGYQQKLPTYISRLSSLAAEIMRFFTFTSSLNYDAYFFIPTLLVTFEATDLSLNEFLEFILQDFNLKEHARDFHFRERDTRVQFARRFFRHIAAVKSVPDNVRRIAIKMSKLVERSHRPDYVRGFLRPCPLYSFVRAITLLEELKKHDDIDINSVEVIVKFLLTKFDPESFGIEDNANVTDIVVTLQHDFNSGPVQLTDGSLSSQHNKELLERLANEASVSEEVKNAIDDVLPLL